MTFQRYFDDYGRRINPGQFFFGGKAPSTPKVEPVKIPEVPQVQMPAPLPPAAPIPPAPTTSNLDVQRAADDQRGQAAKRKGVRRTILAGETGGALAPASSPATGNRTLLG